MSTLRIIAAVSSLLVVTAPALEQIKEVFGS